MKEQKRGFKGIWIPKEIWLSDLSLQEKIFLAEIDSLDNNDNGCFASNAYFSKFFQISKSRCSQVIASLENKKLITSFKKVENNQVVYRKLQVVEGVINILNRGSKYLEVGGSKYSKGGSKFSDTIYHSNITEEKIEEKKNIKKKNIVPSQFDKFWELYPNKKAKGTAFTRWNKICDKSAKERPEWKTIKKALKAQKKSERWQKQPQYIPNASTWLNQNRWLDDAETLSEIQDYKNKNNFGFKGDFKLTKKSTTI